MVCLWMLLSEGDMGASSKGAASSGGKRGLLSVSGPQSGASVGRDAEEQEAEVVENEEEKETREGLSLLLMVSVLCVSFLAAYLIRDFGVTIIHESGVAIVLGMIVGFAVKNIRTVEELKQLIKSGYPFSSSFHVLLLFG